MDDYTWEIATVQEYLNKGSDPDETTFERAEDKILNVGTYIVKVTQGTTIARCV